MVYTLNGKEIGFVNILYEETVEMATFGDYFRLNSKDSIICNECSDKCLEYCTMNSEDMKKTIEANTMEAYTSTLELEVESMITNNYESKIVSEIYLR